MRSFGLVFLFISSLLSAQHSPAPTLQLKTGTVVLHALSMWQGSLPLTKGETRSGRIHRFVAFDHTLNAAERDGWEALGIRFLDPLTGHGWSVSMPAALAPERLMASGMIGMHTPTAVDKLDPALSDALSGKGWRNRSQAVLVLPWSDLDADALDAAPELKGRPFEPQGEEGARLLQLSGRTLAHLLQRTHVQWIAPAPTDGEPEDLRGTTFHRVNPIAPVPGSPNGLDGTGVTVVVNDDGFAGPHIDFQGRTVQNSVASDLTGTHGDMVAGIVGGAGNLDPRNAGMAPGCEIIVRQYQGSLPNTVSLYQNEGAVIFNSSYSDGCNGGYTSTTRKVDQETVANPALIQVFSAGNAGGQDCGYGAGTDWGNISGGHKIAKNCIATANLTDNDLVVASSSRGPSADGRIKPDISAYGNGQISAAPDNGYLTGSGTSAASPGVAGTLAVLYQGWRAIHGTDPASGLIKALVMNTADDLGNVGPDYTFGWGRLNAARAWQAITEERYITGTIDQGQQQTHTIAVPAGVDQVRVMLYWMDPAAALQSTVILVNDLDLLATDPGGTVRRPWELLNTPVASALAAPAFLGEDHVNNVEQVSAFTPQQGNWTVTVDGTDVPSGPQTYFLVFEFVEQGPRITYPLAGDVLATNEQHRFRWDALAGTDPFNVTMSLDSGLTWSTYTPATSDRRYFDLGLGGVVVPNALLRVERNGLTDISGPFTIMSVAQGLDVQVNCIDSALLAWTPTPQASGYIVHRLGAQYMDSVGFTTDTSFVHTGLQAVHNDWFAVTAMAPNGVRARRSNAVARPQQLVNCQADRDLSAVSLVSPVPLVLTCQPEPGLEVMVRNQGVSAVQDFAVGYRVNGGAATTQSFSQQILPGDSALITFSAPLFGLGQLGSNELKVWASALNESYTPNDTLTTEVLSALESTTLPFIEDGEGLDVCSTTTVCNSACNDVGALFNGRNDIDDDIDWRVDTAGTTTANTGPAVDHTLGDPSGRYFYLEASGVCYGREAHLYTPCITLSFGSEQALGFWYHLFGSGQGELHVDLIVDGVLIADAMPPILGDQGDQWKQALLDLSAYEGSTVTARFRGITGFSSLSDMALDDIGLEPATGIAETTAPSSLMVLPTDADGVFNVVLERPAPAGSLLRVMDATGREVERIRPGSSTRPVLDLAGSASGLYLIRLEGGGQVFQGRIVRP